MYSTSATEPARASGPRAETAARPKLTRVDIEVIDAANISYEEFLRRYAHANRPVVVDNCVGRWPAMKKWQPAYFKEKFQQQPVQVAYDRAMPFDQFIDDVMASSAEKPGPYMFRLFLHEHLPELLEDLIPQNVYAYPRRLTSPLMPERLRRPDGYLKLLIGGPGSKFPVMHFDGDNAHASITEIYGDKEMILYAPEDGPNIYPNPKAPNTSMIEDPTSPDLDRFPLLAKAVQYRAVLRPGQMVFIPCRWWHTARPVTPSVSVCVNMLDDSNWPGFVDVACRGSSGLKAVVKRAYLTGLGGLLSACEGLQKASPTLARALVLPLKLSPTSAAVAAEPSARQLKIRIPTD